MKKRRRIEVLIERRELSIFLGKREVKVRHLGRGNTAGDAVVYVPDAKVLISGDLLVLPTPFGIGSYIGDWIQSLVEFQKMGARLAFANCYLLCGERRIARANAIFARADKEG